MASVLFVLNEGHYGSERTYNALRHATAVSGEEGVEVKLFLMADATTCALPAQRPPRGYYSIERMLNRLLNNGALVAL